MLAEEQQVTGVITAQTRGKFRDKGRSTEAGLRHGPIFLPTNKHSAPCTTNSWYLNDNKAHHRVVIAACSVTDCAHSTDLDNYRLQVEVALPYVQTHGDYKINGRILVLLE
jgi:hypothetical protein